MKIIGFNKFLITGLVIRMGLAAFFFLPGIVLAQYYEAYCLYHGAYPDDEEPFYSGECENNTQGITHDDSNWFISQTYDLWKIPVQYDLGENGVSPSAPGVIHVRLKNIKFSSGVAVVDSGYFHIGDLSYYKGYLIAPIEANSPQPHAIFIFRGVNLQYVDHVHLSGYKDLGWVAVDLKGNLYTSRDFSDYLEQWQANWDEFPTKPLQLKFKQQIKLIREDGSSFNSGHAQGGDFSSSSGLFYFLSGIFDSHDPDEGINVFDTQSLSATTWQRVKRSYQGDDYQPFWYHFDPICFPDVPYICEEPEGLTVWDLDKVPNKHSSVKGQLHVVMLDNDATCDKGFNDDENDNLKDDDDITFYHYINTIYVNYTYGGDETGEPHKPFNTVTEAYNVAWNGARIKIWAGNYAEALTFSKQIQILPEGGTVRIGTGGRVSLNNSAAINLYSRGALRLFTP